MPKPDLPDEDFEAVIQTVGKLFLTLSTRQQLDLLSALTNVIVKNLKIDDSVESIQNSGFEMLMIVYHKHIDFGQMID